MDPKQFQTCFLQWIRAVAQRVHRQIISIDGKKLRRSHDRTRGKDAIAMVSAWATANHLVLGQCQVENKSNEMTAIPPSKQPEYREIFSRLSVQAKSVADSIQEMEALIMRRESLIPGVILAALGSLLVLIAWIAAVWMNQPRSTTPVPPGSYISQERAIEIAVEFSSHPGFGPAYTGSSKPRVKEAELMTYGEATERIGEGNYGHARNQAVWLVILEGSWGPQFVSGPPTAIAPPSYTPLPSPKNTAGSSRYYRLILDATTGDFIQTSVSE